MLGPGAFRRSLMRTVRARSDCACVLGVLRATCGVTTAQLALPSRADPTVPRRVRQRRLLAWLIPRARESCVCVDELSCLVHNRRTRLDSVSLSWVNSSVLWHHRHACSAAWSHSTLFQIESCLSDIEPVFSPACKASVSRSPGQYLEPFQGPLGVLSTK